MKKMDSYRGPECFLVKWNIIKKALLTIKRLWSLCLNFMFLSQMFFGMFCLIFALWIHIWIQNVADQTDPDPKQWFYSILQNTAAIWGNMFVIWRHRFKENNLFCLICENNHGGRILQKKKKNNYCRFLCALWSL